MSDGTESEIAERVLKLNVWVGAANHYAVRRADVSMTPGGAKRGLTELVRLGLITHDKDGYTITDDGRAARKALLER